MADDIAVLLRRMGRDFVASFGSVLSHGLGIVLGWCVLVNLTIVLASFTVHSAFDWAWRLFK